MEACIFISRPSLPSEEYHIIILVVELCEMGVKANAALHVDVTGPGIMTVIMSWVAQCFCYDPYL